MSFSKIIPGMLLAAFGLSAAMAQSTKEYSPSGPTFAQIYANYTPDFLETKRLARKEPYQLSLQPWFYNMTQVEHDHRVDALIKKGDELFAAQDFRGAIKLYHEVATRFASDLWRIEANGIFIRSGLYAQRQLLRMPAVQLAYYRTLYDAEAKQLFERAKKQQSLLDMAEVAERYLATSYGARALWELGNTYLDQGNWAKALFYFQQIRDYIPVHDLGPAELSLRLAVCYKTLGMEQLYSGIKQELPAGKGQVFLQELDKLQRPPASYFRQIRNPHCVSLGDYDLFPDPSVPIDRRQFVWSEALPQPQREWYVRALPWVSGNALLYLHQNVIYCRSLLSGQLNWGYAPGGRMDWFDTTPYPLSRFLTSPSYHPESDLLVHEGLVYASIYKDGPSLAAVDQVTGQQRWARGAMNATVEERSYRYLAPPAPGPNVVYAPYVYDDIEGNSHLTSRVGLQCLDSQTGRLIWSREVCLLTPPKFSTGSRVRRIRILGTQPLAKDGFIYCVTNGGVVAALDALSGTILWVTRYPHLADTHDLLQPLQGPQWFSRPPLLHDGRLFATPADSNLLLCLEASTGKVLWSLPRPSGAQTMVGINAAGELVLTGNSLLGVNSQTGKKLWERNAFPVDHTSQIPTPNHQVIARPMMTRSNQIYFNSTLWTGIHGEQFWDMGAKKTLAQRWYYRPADALKNYNETVQKKAAAAGREPDPSELAANTTDPLTTFHRMTFERHGTVFELEISPRAVSLWYDFERVAAAVAHDSSPQGLFNQAELKEVQGDRKAAIALCEKVLEALPGFPVPFRIEVNRQLFRLYRREAEGAMRAGDLVAAEKICQRMALACTTSSDEIFTIFALAEIAERQGRWSDATAALTGAIKHYRGVKVSLPAVLVGDTLAMRGKAKSILKNLEGKSPKQYYASELALALGGAEALLDNYFSIISPLEPDVDMMTDQFAGQWLRRLLTQGSGDYRKEREAAADLVLGKQMDQEILLKLIGEFPGTRSAQKTLDRLLEAAGKLPDPARRIAYWQLNQIGRHNGLEVPPSVQEICNIRVVEPPLPPLSASYYEETFVLDYDIQTLVRVLQPADNQAARENLTFLGTRAKRINANKFGLACWDLQTRQKRWEAAEIRLKDKGEEEGFSKYHLHNGKVVVHGEYDVLAFSLSDGKLAWRTQTPHGFRILDAAVAEDVMVLTDNSRTLALHLATGQVIWDANESGGAYSPPYLRDNLLITVRRNPSGVAFRDLGTGKLLNHLALPTLSEITRSPAVSWDDSAVPLTQAGDSLVVTDGWEIIAIDLASRKVRWQRRITDLDHGEPESIAFRFWTDGTSLAVLRRFYDRVGLEVLNLADGTLSWQIQEGKSPGVPHHVVLGPKNVHGIYQSQTESSAISMLGYGLKDGTLSYKEVQRGLTKPESWLAGPLRGERFVVNVSDEQKRMLMVVEAATGRIAHKLEVKGFGQWGQYGQMSQAVAGPCLVLLSDKQLTIAHPKKN